MTGQRHRCVKEANHHSGTPAAADSLDCDRHVKQTLAENSRVLASVRRVLLGGGLESRRLRRFFVAMFLAANSSPFCVLHVVLITLTLNPKRGRSLCFQYGWLASSVSLNIFPCGSRTNSLSLCWQWRS
jgi:hypothetical protein